MAVLSEQREIIRALDKLARKRFEKSAIKHSVIGAYLMGSEAKLWSAENELVNQMLSDKCLNQSHLYEVDKLKELLRISIEKEFIASKPNENYKSNIRHGIDTPNFHESSMQLVKVNPDKGSELLNWWYFWLKYIPETFPQLSGTVLGIGASIITSFLTSGFIWWYVINYVIPSK